MLFPNEHSQGTGFSTAASSTSAKRGVLRFFDDVAMQAPIMALMRPWKQLVARLRFHRRQRTTKHLVSDKVYVHLFLSPTWRGRSICPALGPEPELRTEINGRVGPAV